MAHSISIPTNTDREKVYKLLIPQIKALLGDEKSTVANMANFVAALKEGLQFFWIGFYLVDGNELVLGPFQGPVACTRIGKGKGVCGKAWELGEPLLVEDVEQFPGHIACSSASKSEIVIPLKDTHGNVWGVLDVDSVKYADFSETDRANLSELLLLITP